MRHKSRAKRSIGIDIDPEVTEMWRNMNQLDLNLTPSGRTKKWPQRTLRTVFRKI